MPDQGQTRDSSHGLLIASGMFNGSCRADPAKSYLGTRCLALKVVGKFFQRVGDPCEASVESRV
jgi:hypothetical protein